MDNKFWLDFLILIKIEHYWIANFKEKMYISFSCVSPVLILLHLVEENTWENVGISIKFHRTMGLVLQ